MARLRAQSFLALLGAALLAGSGCAFQPLVDNPDPKGRSVVLLLDASASMRENDPDRASVAGASLALALAGQKENVGVLAYADHAEVLVPLHPAGDGPRRAEAVAALAEVGRSGATDFAAALEAAAAMFEAAQAPRGSCAIFLTDGLPTGRISRRREFAEAGAARALTVPDAVSRIASHGWRIFAIALGPEGAQARPYLTQLVAPTGGAVFEAKDSSALVKVFQEVSVQALGYLSAEELSGSSEVQAPPETKRLAFVAGSIGALARDGKDLEASRAIRTQAGSIAAALVDGPEPGTYRADVGSGSLAVALLEPGWYLELEPGAPPPSVKHGARVPVATLVRGEATVLARVRDRLQLSLELKAGDRVLATAPLGRASGESLRFEGAFVVPEKEESLTLTVTASLVEGGRTFTSRRSVSIAVEKGHAEPPPALKTLALDVSPSRVELVGFAGDELKATLSVRGDPAQPSRVSLEAPPGFSVSPASLDLGAGKSATVEVRATKPDAASGRLVVGAKLLSPVLGGESPQARFEVALSASRASFAPESLDLGRVIAGEAARGRLEGTCVSFAAGLLKGPGGATIPLVVEAAPGNPASGSERGGPSSKQAWTVAAHPPEKAAPGTYSGELVARAGQSTRRVSATLEVARRPVRAPDKLTLEASWGWASVKFDLEGARADSVQVGALGIEPSGTARIDPDLDIRTAELAPGKFELRVYLAATLPPGKYMGWLKAELESGPKEIPIVLEVKR
jgi:hypothetical protein